ncbi:hypothetical protein V6N13_135140 [Hibiscus sabdariffa]
MVDVVDNSVRNVETIRNDESVRNCGIVRSVEYVKNDDNSRDDEESEYIAYDNQDSDSVCPLEDNDNDMADGDDEVCDVHVGVGRDIPRFNADKKE